jgi:hypothetical protein
MVANLLFFGIAGIGLLLMGVWGLRRSVQLSRVESWDEDSREHRRAVVRRGCYTCVVLGVLFLGIAVASPFLSPAR